MLPKDIARLKFENGMVVPQYIRSTPRYIELARSVLDVYRLNVESTYGDLHDALDELIGVHQQHRLLKGFAHILEPRLTFKELPDNFDPISLRQKIFEKSAKIDAENFAKVQTWKFEIIKELANELQIEERIIEEMMYSDLKEQRWIVDFLDITEDELISAYNLALAQSALLKAKFLEFTLSLHTSLAAQELRKLFATIKFFGLLFDVKQISPNKYFFHLDGPNSVLQQPQKYGFQLACFLPTLFKYANWEATAKIGWNSMDENLDFSLKPDDFTIEIQKQPYRIPEEVELLANRLSEIAPNWESSTNPPLLKLGGQNIWIPDLELCEKNSGKTVLIEIIGAWRSSYIEKRLELLTQQKTQNLLLIVHDKWKGFFSAFSSLVATTIFYKTVPRPKLVLEAMKQIVAKQS